MSSQAAGEMSAEFPSTCWSDVVDAGRVDGSADSEALNRLCASYWSPLYAWLRRKGYSPQDAEDLVQGFLARVIAREDLGMVGPEKGRFRTFLLVGLRNFALKHVDRERAIKRGGGVRTIPIDLVQAEAICRMDQSLESPEAAFDRRWCRTIVSLALKRLSDEQTARGRAEVFRELLPFLDGAEPGEFTAAASSLGMTTGAVGVALHRLRLRLREHLREEVSRTVASSAELDEELRHLMNVWSG